METKRPLFSLVIPCYNSAFIGRLFDSIASQGITNEELEIIVVDDSSTDKSYQDVVKSYKLNTKFVNTAPDIVHCPGNTRSEGLKHITGEWVFFSDHDDYFEKDGLVRIKQVIEDNKDNPPLAIASVINESNPFDDDHITPHDADSGWLHGKFYNVDNFIRKYRIDFLKDLTTEEDIYFNCNVIARLTDLGTDYLYLPFAVYRWVNNPESLSRAKREDRGYFYENFHNYIYATSEPYWYGIYGPNKDFHRHQILMCLLHCYFYFEGATYREGSERYEDIYKKTQKLLFRILERFKWSFMQVVEYIYKDPVLFQTVQKNCEYFTGKFIAKTSFKDLIVRMVSDI